MTGIETDGHRQAEVAYRTAEGYGTVAAGHVLVGASPHELAALLGERPPAAAEGAQLKVNMLLKRLPQLRDPAVDPRQAFAGTFHIAEGYEQLATAYSEAAEGRPPSAPPSEIYCHSLTDPTVLGPELAGRGYHTLTLFGLHTPARLFAADNDAVRESLLASTLAQLDGHLAEPLADCLAEDADGRPCIEAKTPLDLERDLRLPGGNIFHRDLAFPHAQEGTGRWGVETGHANVLLCGAGGACAAAVSAVSRGTTPPWPYSGSDGRDPHPAGPACAPCAPASAALRGGGPATGSPRPEDRGLLPAHRHWPTLPSTRSRRKSACPQCRAYSSIRCTSSSRIAMQSSPTRSPRSG